jgi:uncharacterized protein Yka (UPF0111/DUF47 family)
VRRKRRWFLPEVPDLVDQLSVQAKITLEGLEAFAAWAAGDPEAADTLAEIEHRGDTVKRELLEELREAFITPLSPEDLFALSRGLDWILNYTRDLASEAKAMDSAPDEILAEMAGLLRDSVAQLGEAIGQLGSSGDEASAAADRAITTERRLEHTYFQGMADLLKVDARDKRISSRELYRRCVRIGDEVIEVAERIIYSVVKES